MQKSLIIYAVDDGYFPSHAKSGRYYTTLVLVKYAYNTRPIPLDLAIGKILVDFDDVEQKILQLYNEVMRYKARNNDYAILLDGVTYAGFNVVDPVRLSNKLNLPVIVTFYKNLNLSKIRHALQKHFLDHEYRFNILRNVYIASTEIPTRFGKVRIYAYGIDLPSVRELIENLQVYSRMPEPLRVAHIIASTIAKTLYSTHIDYLKIKD